MSERFLNDLHRIFGFDGFLPGQSCIVERIMDGDDVCAIMPTGAGKSLCYQLPILLKEGYGIVVSPLISLMKDQVDALVDLGIPATSINSSVSGGEQNRRLIRAERGEIKILYVAPERFRAPSFRNLLQEKPPSLLVVDEAHCISHWGHDFRPDYLRLGQVLEELAIPQIAAFTATATPLVQKDIVKALRRPDMHIEVAGFKRPNLSFSVLHTNNKEEKLTQLHHICQEQVPTIIYASTRKNVEEVMGELNCAGYHAGMDGAERERIQQCFMTEEAPVLVATNAFGMGIDRKDVKRVIHYNLPGTLEAYYQEAGRAGRNGEDAECILLFSYQDKHIQNFLIDMNNPSPQVLREIYRLLQHRCGHAPDGAITDTNNELAEHVPSAKSDAAIGAGLRILERLGAVERGSRRDARGHLRFLKPVADLRQIHQHASTQRSRFLYCAALEYGDRLKDGVWAGYGDLAAVAGLSVEQIKRVLQALKGDSIEWTPPFSGRVITLPTPEAELELDEKEIERKRNFDMQRLDDVISYAQVRNCRQSFLVEYFGEPAGSWKCGVCDICNKLSGQFHRAPNADELSVLMTILRSVRDMEGRVGRSRIVKYLRGEDTPMIGNQVFDGLEWTGELTDIPAKQLFQLMGSLERNGCLETVGDPQYPCLGITRTGMDALAGQKKLKADFSPLKRSQTRQHSTPQTSSKPRSQTANTTNANSDLYDKLRTLQKELAAERDLPSYRILPNGALRALAEEMPVTPQEAKKIKGIGDVKARTIIPKFLTIIKQWRQENLQHS